MIFKNKNSDTGCYLNFSDQELEKTTLPDLRLKIIFFQIRNPHQI